MTPYENLLIKLSLVAEDPAEIQAFRRMAREAREHRWATDPMNLMPWLRIRDWRWRLGDWLRDLAAIVDPWGEDDG
jgi:hypothetical protein